MKRILILTAVLIAASYGAALYFAVSPDSHFVVVNRAGDTLWKSSAIADSSWVDATLTGMALNDTLGLVATLSKAGFSSGRISGGVLSDAGSGKVAMSALKGFIRTSDTDTSTLKTFTLAACTTAALPNSDLSYIYVKLSGGVPKCTTTTSRAAIHTTDEFTIGRGYRNDGTVDVLNTGITVANFERSVHERFTEEDRFDHAGGSVITAATGLHLRTTAGIFHTGLTHINMPAWSSDTANFEHYYWDSLGTWVEVAARASVDSMRYSDGSAALQTVGVARYGVHWPYLGPKGKISVVYGSGSYTLPQADTASAPGTLPNYLAKFSVLVGKVIVGRADASFTSVASAFATQFQLGTVVDHNKLGGLSGGTTDEYFHLTSAQHDTVTTGKVNAKTLQGKDTLAMHIYAGRDSAKVQVGDTLRGKRLFIVDATTGAPDQFLVSNTAATGRASFGMNNDVATTFYIQSLGSNYAYASYRNVAALAAGGANLLNMSFVTNAGVSSGGTSPIYFYAGGYGVAPGLSIIAGNPGAVVVCSIAARGTEKLFVKGGVLIAGPTQIDSSLKVARLIVGDTVLIRTAGAAFAAIKRFATYADSCAGVDSIQLTALNASGARARVITLRDSVFVKDGATVVKILSAAGKWCDVEYLGAPCSRWQVFGSN